MNEKLKKILESPITKGLVIGSAGTGACCAGCVLSSIIGKKFQILGDIATFGTITAGIATGALAYLMTTNEVEKDQQESYSTVGQIKQEPFDI